MKKLLLILLCLPIIGFGQIFGQVDIEYNTDKIKYWDKEDTLIYSDFILKENAESIELGFHKFGQINYRWAYIYDSDTNVTAIRNVMYTDNKSFIVNHPDRFTTLKHESAHFDISEMYLRKALDEISKLDLSFSMISDIPVLFNSINKQMKEILYVYKNLELKRQNNFHEVLKNNVYVNNNYLPKIEIEECRCINDSLLNDFNNYNDAEVFFTELTTLKNKYRVYIQLRNKASTMHKKFVNCANECLKLMQKNLIENFQIKYDEAIKYYKLFNISFDEALKLFPDIEHDLEQAKRTEKIKEELQKIKQ
tara:strand:- start:691 stop:1614 length:924 start_codon:yes stop_codon:yes gene_type:complete